MIFKVGDKVKILCEVVCVGDDEDYPIDLRPIGHECVSLSLTKDGKWAMEDSKPSLFPCKPKKKSVDKVDVEKEAEKAWADREKDVLFGSARDWFETGFRAACEMLKGPKKQEPTPEEIIEAHQRKTGLFDFKPVKPEPVKLEIRELTKEESAKHREAISSFFKKPERKLKWKAWRNKINGSLQLFPPDEDVPSFLRVPSLDVYEEGEK